MASATITVNQQYYPESSALAAYAASDWQLPYDPEGEPAPTPVATATVTSGKVTFTGLTAGAHYWLTYEVPTPPEERTVYPYVYFMLAETAPLAIPALPDPLPATPYTLTMTYSDDGTGPVLAWA